MTSGTWPIKLLLRKEAFSKKTEHLQAGNIRTSTIEQACTIVLESVGILPGHCPSMLHSIQQFQRLMPACWTQNGVEADCILSRALHISNKLNNTMLVLENTAIICARIYRPQIAWMVPKEWSSDLSDFLGRTWRIKPLKASFKLLLLGTLTWHPLPSKSSPLFHTFPFMFGSRNL